MYLSSANPRLSSSNPVLKGMWPEGKLSITEVTKRPLTAATLFKNSMILLVENLASKVTKHWPRTHTRSKRSICDDKEKLTSRLWRPAVLSWRLTPGYIWHYLTLCRPLLASSGTVLRPLHQAQRCQVASAVRGGALPPPGGVPWPAGERASAPRRIRIQTDVPSLPAEVSAET